MIILTPGAQTAIAQENVPIVQLVYFQFSTTPLALNSSNWDLTYGGVLYRGAYGMGRISEIDDSPGEIKGLQFTLSGDSADMVALALDDAAIWQGTPITIRTAILDPATYQILDAPVAWSGKGDTMSIEAQPGSTVIQATAESSAVDLLKGHVLHYSNVDQQMLYPGDNGFGYVVSQVDKPIVWPSKEFFYQ
jgi:hypothetical protein